MDNEIPFEERGRNVTVHEHCIFRHPERIVLKDNILLSSYVTIDAGRGVYIGSHTDLSFHAAVYGGGYCFIDDFVSISAGCRLITGMDNLDDSMLANNTLPDSYRSYSRSFIYLQKHVFLATNVVVYPGVVIGEGAVVGTDSIVTDSLAPWGVYVGSPPRKVRSRLNEDIRRLAARMYRNGLPESKFNEIFHELVRTPVLT